MAFVRLGRGNIFGRQTDHEISMSKGKSTVPSANPSATRFGIPDQMFRCSFHFGTPPLLRLNFSPS